MAEEEGPPVTNAIVIKRRIPTTPPTTMGFFPMSKLDKPRPENINQNSEVRPVSACVSPHSLLTLRVISPLARCRRSSRPLPAVCPTGSRLGPPPRSPRLRQAAPVPRNNSDYLLHPVRHL